jgi:hypothetical protein
MERRKCIEEPECDRRGPGVKGASPAMSAGDICREAACGPETDLRCLRPGWSRSNPFRLERGDTRQSAGYRRPFRWDFSRIPEQACDLGLPLEAGARVRRLGLPREMAQHQGTVEYVAWPTVRMVRWDDGVREYVPLRNLVDLEESVRPPKPRAPRYVRKPQGRRAETERAERLAEPFPAA